ncbi:MAG: exodeoxyribonuclease VII small subunit [Verrucomicrobiales bacterium]
MKRSNPNSEAPFEAALADLESIVAKMESSDLPLEEMISGYEDGIRLLRICEERIAAARQRVEKIARAGADGAKLAPFEGESAGESASNTPNDELF